MLLYKKWQKKGKLKIEGTVFDQKIKTKTVAAAAKEMEGKKIADQLKTEIRSFEKFVLNLRSLFMFCLCKKNNKYCWNAMHS